MNLSNIRLTAAVLCALVVAAVVPAPAQTSISTCPSVITKPGNYKVTADLKCTGTYIAFNIRSSNVTLDLNGHTIYAVIGIYVNDPYAPASGGRLSHIAIRGPGIFLASDTAVVLYNVDHAEVSRLAMYSFAGISAINSTFATLTSNAVTDARTGIYLSGSRDCTLTDNDTSRSSDQGLFLTDGINNVVRNHVANANKNYGIRVSNETGSQVLHSIANANTGYGIALDGGRNVRVSNSTALVNWIDVYDVAGCPGHSWLNTTYQLTYDALRSCIH